MGHGRERRRASLSARVVAQRANRVGRQAGFTLLELAVVVIAVALLIGVLLERVLPLIGRAERLAFVQVQKQVQNALTLEAATLITEGRSNRLGDLGTINPMSLFLAPPPNYLGSLPSPPNPNGVPGGTWYFDEHARSLAYRVGKYTRFDALGGPPNRVEFRVAFVFDDRDGDAAFDTTRDRFAGLRLEPRHAYKWPD
jgi:type II secretory pathway pseudopilin PulG